MHAARVARSWVSRVLFVLVTASAVAVMHAELGSALHAGHGLAGTVPTSTHLAGMEAPAPARGTTADGGGAERHPGGHHDGLTHLCLAVLTVFLSVATIALGLSGWRPATAAPGAARTADVRQARSPPAVGRLLLTRLCVLRL